MIRSGKWAVIAAVLCGLNVSAQFVPQNARTNALGGTFIMDDMNDILRYAVFMDQYKDGAQATFNGPITGIKAIGDVMSLGVIANRGWLLDNSSTTSFYQLGSSTLTGITGIPALTAQNVPHLLLGVNLSAVTLGFDLFYEYASASYHNETPATPSVITDGTTRIHNPGGVASALFGPEDIPIAVKFGLGFPSISGKYDNETTETKIESDKGVFVEVGGEAELPVSDLRLTLGLDFIFERYKFSRDNVTVGDCHNNRLAFYGGFEGDLFTTAKWGALYNLAVSNGRTAAADTSNIRTLLQTISCGIENSWSSVWIFDECFARGGLTFAMRTPVTYTRNASTSTDSRRREQTTYSPVTPTVGIGVQRKGFSCDITLNPTAWTGVVAGPAVGMVTLGIMF